MNAHDATASRRLRRIPADRFFFPAAVTYALVAVPLSVQGLLGDPAWAPGLASPLGHGQGVLFGFALALVAGFLVTRVSAGILAALAGLWLLGRVATLWPAGMIALVPDALFVVLLAVLIVPPLLRRAKKWRNLAFGWLLLTICLAALTAPVLRLLTLQGPAWLLLREAVLLFALLMLFVGGRIIAPAVAGAIERQGGRLTARVQPQLEAALLILMAAAAIALALPTAGILAGSLLWAAAALAAIRLLRWRLWRCRHRPDLITLGIGYAWLVVGIALLGAQQLGAVTPGTATHAVTVGALGHLASAVITRTWGHRHRWRPEQYRYLLPLSGLLSLSAAARLLWADTVTGLWLAAGLWSLALGLLLAQMVRMAWRPAPRPDSPTHPSENR
ncbi:NnrS family protein [Alkalilimnicola ehrlichii]|uniref:NnrS family protein n=1 Tax=Alkalilimnicola ehrlichii TaxID=351052 RepID=UPI003BA1FDE2